MALSGLCTLFFSFDGGIRLEENARIQAPVAILHSDSGTIHLERYAHVTSTGLGRCGPIDGAAASMDRPPNGGEHAGRGGSCDDLEQPPARGDATFPGYQQGEEGEGFGGGVAYESDRTDTSSWSGDVQGVSRFQARCCGGGYVELRSPLPMIIDGQVSSDGRKLR